MILITRIESEDLSPKIQAIISKNLVNNSISKILIFTNSKFKSNNKRIIVIEDGISDKDCIIKSKQIYPNEIFLWSNKWSNIFNTSLSKYDSKDNKETFYSSSDGEQNFIIFNPINFSPKFYKIIDCIHGRKIDVTNDNLFVKSIDTIKPNKDVNIQSDVIKKKGVKYVAPSVFLPVNKIDTIIVSVNYNDFLVLILKYNKKYLQNITVVTSPDDKRCMEICEAFDVNCVITDKMYEDGAEFNKGRAINEGIKSIKDPDWILLLDADTILTEKIKIEPLETNTIYTSDRYYCYEYSTLNRWSNNEISLQQLGDKEIENGYGFFQLFNIRDIKNREKVYSEDYNDAAVSDTKFSESFEKKENLTSCIHLGRIRENWKGRISSAFISEEQINEIIKKQNETTICSYYFNFRNDPRQKENFIKFLSQFKGFYDKMIVGLIDYEDGDIDFDIPCKKIIIKGDKTNRLWSKELIINKIIENIDTGYIIWIDGDLIYEDLSWLNDINSIIKGNDFVQLFETINYLGENGEILETHKSIVSAGRNNVDELLKEGYKPGGSWLGKTSILKEKKLFDQMYVGGGDTIFTYGLFQITEGWTLNRVKENNPQIYKECINWIESLDNYKVGFLDLAINHMYHGHLKDRNYNERYNSLKEVKKEIKIVIFTENIGQYDSLNAINSYKNTRCVAFTDDDKKIDGWEIVNINNIQHIRNLKNAKLICKYIRTHSHELLPEFDYCLHIDANMILQEDPIKIIQEAIEKEVQIMAFTHYKRKSVYEEASQCLDWKLDSEKKIIKQIERYKEEQLGNGLFECGFLLRKKCLEVQEFDKIWWNEIYNNSYRDQISFPYVLQKTKVKFGTFNEPNRFKSKYLTIKQNLDGSTHKGSRVFNNNLLFIYEDSRVNWGSTKMRGFDICQRLDCQILPLSQSENIKYKKIVILKLSDYKKIIDLSKNNEIVIDMVDFNQHIHDLSIFKNFDYGIFTSNAQMSIFKDYFKYPEKCCVIYHHWDERLKSVKIKKLDETKICYFGQPEKCFDFGLNSDIDYHQVDWYDFEDKKSLLENYNVHISVKPTKEMLKIQPTTKISTASCVGCPIIVNKDEQSVELLTTEYPYFCESNLESIKAAIDKVRNTFLQEDWFRAKMLMEEVKVLTNIDVTSKKYLDL